MNPQQLARRSAVILAVVMGGGLASSGAEQPPRGVVVEDARATGTAARAGLRPGDVLLSWTSTALPAGGMEGGLDSPFDLAEVQAAHGHCGPVTFALRRAGRALSATLDPGDWLVDVRPAFLAQDEAAYAAARALTSPQGVDRRVAGLRELAAVAGRRGDGDTQAWLLVQAGNALAARGRREEQQRAFAEAREATTASIRRAAVWEAEAQAISLGDIPLAQAALRHAIDLRRPLPGPALGLAADLNRLGRLLISFGDDAAAEIAYREAWALAEAARPGSLVSAVSLGFLGSIVAYRSHEEAAALMNQSLAICDVLAPDSLATARALSLLGGLAHRAGDHGLAEDYWRRAFALQERLDAEGPSPISTLYNLALVASARGDNAKAEQLLRRVLASYEKDSPFVEVADLLYFLGLLAEERNDLAAAEGLYGRSLAMAEGLTPGSMTTARAVSSLGDTARKTGRSSEALALYRRAQELLERLAPDSVELATYLIGPARLLWEDGNGSAAVDLAARAVTLLERLAPTGFFITEPLLLLGDIAGARGDRGTAGQLYERVLAVRSRLAPGTRLEAESLHALARLRRDEGRFEVALELSGRAVDALDRQRTRIGGSYEARSRFSATTSAAYRDHIDLLLEKGDTAGAFHVFERSRARAFLDLLAERELDLAEASPEQEKERRALDAEYDRLQESITASSGTSAAEAVATTLGKLRELQDRRETLIQRVRLQSPRLAAIRYPVPLDLDVARATLDPGTVLLAYAVGPARTVVFVVESAAQPGPGLTVLTVPVGEARLRQQVELFRREMERGLTGDGRVLTRHGAELYALLVEPAEAHLSRADRIAVSPDGPLHVLPFGALTRKGAPLLAWKPLHLVPSVTAAAELTKARLPRSNWDRDLVAFGEPLYSWPQRPGDPAPSPADAERDRLLRPLPATKHEVQAIGALFPGRAQVFVGSAATEEKAKALGSGARYVHFACHGLLNRRFPLDSALALSRSATPAAGENGLLQAWEILEGGRLDADLVTLSACQSGLGAEVGGEGLLGLTRAFLHAGARSVVASLWRVSDRSTARLMERFYRQLAKGVPKDVALRAAQLEMIRAGGPHRHPFYWAAFHLVGDWK